MQMSVSSGREERINLPAECNERKDMTRFFDEVQQLLFVIQYYLATNLH